MDVKSDNPNVKGIKHMAFAVSDAEKALAAYPGALVLVSHDRRFAESCTTSQWQVEGGRVG